MAMTADGRIADINGKSRWITGAAARSQVQSLRRRSDAVLVGGTTAMIDDPGLLPERPGKLFPLRVVVDSRGRLSSGLTLFCDGYAQQTLVCTTSAAPAAWCTELRETGAEVLVLPSRQGSVSLKRLLRELGGRGVMRLLCEGGGELAGSLVSQGLVDDMYLFVAPKLLLDGTPVFNASGRSIASSLELEFVGMEMCGKDCLIRAIPRSGKE
jgi:diaminohydroxyphosphoribosylaminopyrimidine deaminase/5-amino-6-(5-phosphoribosylamino)uracil reductase